MNGVNIPKRATKKSAGYDFVCPEKVDLYPGVWKTIDTGVSFDGTEKVDFDNWFRYNSWVMMIFPRSGLSNKYGFKIKNTVAIIDMDYRDTIKLTVTVDKLYTIQKGERFAQGVLLPFGTFEDEIEPEETRKGGFGSTGKV